MYVGLSYKKTEFSSLWHKIWVHNLISRLRRKNASKYVVLKIGHHHYFGEHVRMMQSLRETDCDSVCLLSSLSRWSPAAFGLLLKRAALWTVTITLSIRPFVCKMTVFRSETQTRRSNLFGHKEVLVLYFCLCQKDFPEIEAWITSLYC